MGEFGFVVSAHERVAENARGPELDPGLWELVPNWELVVATAVRAASSTVGAAASPSSMRRTAATTAAVRSAAAAYAAARSGRRSASRR